MITGEMLIGRHSVRGSGAGFNGTEAATGAALPPVFSDATADDVARACALASGAVDAYCDVPPEQRATFLDAIAQSLLDLGDVLIDRACAETGLARGRIEGERGRTIGQLRLFAALVREGSWTEARIDPAMPDRQPLPRPDLRQRHIPLGPVAVFGASNFPLAFSVAGGDTESALAAGCPVVAKAHPAHPGTSELVGRAIQATVQRCGLPEGVFSLLFGAGNELGLALVGDPRIAAVGFTGSRGGGLALMQAAAQRPVPIPVYAEMSSINPIFLLRHALGSRAAEIGRGLAASLTMGAGQFCTNPGLILAEDGPALDEFIGSAAAALAAIPAATMLSRGILSAYQTGVARLSETPHVQSIGKGRARTEPTQGEAVLFVTDAAAFQADATLAHEVFGAASLVVRCPDAATMRDLAEGLEGQLTATLMMDPADLEQARALLPVLERRVGRILVNGFPTGVEVSHAMVHGGPFPSTSDGRTTSVGTLAIRRFLRPICYQDFPSDLLPEALRDPNTGRSYRLRDGVFGIH